MASPHLLECHLLCGELWPSRDTMPLRAESQSTLPKTHFNLAATERLPSGINTRLASVVSFVEAN